jgi:hypothetical protein
LTKGHSFGSQGALIDTEEGKYFAAGDTYPLYLNYETNCPPGIHTDLRDWYASKVLERSVYGMRLA